jgi:formate dehydrogenase major subunit
MFQQIGLPYHWGSHGLVRGDSANELSGLSADPNVSIMNSKAHTANIQAGRVAAKVRLQRQVDSSERLPGNELRDLPIVGHNRPEGKHRVVASRDKQGEQT